MIHTETPNKGACWTDRTYSAKICSTVSPQALLTGLPQGSMIGPSEFPSYNSPLFAIGEKLALKSTCMWKTLNGTCLSMWKLWGTNAMVEDCLSEMRAWLAQNHLKLNDVRTGCLVIGQKNSVYGMTAYCSHWRCLYGCCNICQKHWGSD